MARSSIGQVVELDRKGGRTFALRFRAYGKRRYLTLGTAEEGWTRAKAEEELANVLADVRRGIWKPPKPAPTVEEKEEPTFHEFASEWLNVAPRRVRAANRRGLRACADPSPAAVLRRASALGDHRAGGRPLQGGEGPRARAGPGRPAALEPDDQQDADPARADPRRGRPLRPDRPQPGQDEGREAEGGRAAAGAADRRAGAGPAPGGGPQPGAARDRDHGRRPPRLRADPPSLARPRPRARAS